jgi:hypothetical protein
LEHESLPNGPMLRSGGRPLIFIGQFTTNGVFSGVINEHTFVHGIHLDYSLDLGLEFGPDNITEMGCTDSSFPNYNPVALFDAGSCILWGGMDGDGVVDTSDILAFIASYGCVQDCGAAYLNGDGVVNALDLLALQANF